MMNEREAQLLEFAKQCDARVECLMINPPKPFGIFITLSNLVRLVNLAAPSAVVEMDADRLREIARIAHAGGALGLSEGDALNDIRRLTLANWNHDAARATPAPTKSPAAPDA